MNDPLRTTLPEALSSSSSGAGKDHPTGFAPLHRAAVVFTWGLPALGLVQAARLLAAMIRMPSQGFFGWADRLLEIIFLTGACALAGIAIGALLRALEQWVLVFLIRQHAPDQKALTSLTEKLDRLAPQPRGGEGPEVSPIPAEPPSRAALEGRREQSAAEIGQAIRSARWDEAKSLLAAFSSDHVDDPRLSALQEELQTARAKARDEHLARLEAARKVNDPERVLELHQDLVPLLGSEARSTLDGDLSRWFLRLIHNRLRSGKIQADLAHLAGRIAETFSHTVEGASLRASLPTLRRSAGLCPRCSQPYTGIDDACPVCLGQGDRTVRPANPDDGPAESV